MSEWDMWNDIERAQKAKINIYFISYYENFVSYIELMIDFKGNPMLVKKLRFPPSEYESIKIYENINRFFMFWSSKMEYKIYPTFLLFLFCFTWWWTQRELFSLIALDCNLPSLLFLYKILFSFTSDIWWRKFIEFRPYKFNKTILWIINITFLLIFKINKILTFMWFVLWYARKYWVPNDGISLNITIFRAWFSFNEALAYWLFYVFRYCSVSSSF